MDREAWRAAVHGVTKSWTRLSDWTELNGLSILCCVLLVHFPHGSHSDLRPTSDYVNPMQKIL